MKTTNQSRREILWHLLARVPCPGIAQCTQEVNPISQVLPGEEKGRLDTGFESYPRNSVLPTWIQVLTEMMPNLSPLKTPAQIYYLLGMIWINTHSFAISPQLQLSPSGRNIHGFQFLPWERKSWCLCLTFLAFPGADQEIGFCLTQLGALKGPSIFEAPKKH